MPNDTPAPTPEPVLLEALTGEISCVPVGAVEQAIDDLSIERDEYLSRADQLVRIGDLAAIARNDGISQGIAIAIERIQAALKEARLPLPAVELTPGELPAAEQIGAVFSREPPIPPR